MGKYKCKYCNLCFDSEEERMAHYALMERIFEAIQAARTAQPVVALDVDFSE